MWIFQCKTTTNWIQGYKYWKNTLLSGTSCWKL